jgi:hypothetical protein
MHYKLVLSRFQFIYKQFTYTSAAIAPFCTMHGERSHSRVDKQPRSGSNIFTARKFTLPLNKSCLARRRCREVSMQSVFTTISLGGGRRTHCESLHCCAGGQSRNSLRCCERHAAVCACCLFCSHKVNNSLPGFLQK